MSFDKEGFFFTIKFLAVVCAVFLIMQSYSDTVFSSAVPIAFNTDIVDRASATLRQTRAAILHDAAASGVAEEIPSSADIKIAFVGDIMLDRSVGAAVNVFGAGDFHYPFLYIRDTLAGYALTFANLEGPIADHGQNQGGRYSFRMDPRAAEGLAFAGIDLVSLANNHSGDWGAEALADTFLYLSQEHISYIGAGLSEEEAYTPKLLRVGDAIIAFLAYTESGGAYRKGESTDLPSIALVVETRLAADIARARASADIVVVSFHFGDEYNNKPNEYQRVLSHHAIDVGADLVVGHHPHVVQPLEKYGTGFIAYSLGNFVFDQNFSPDTMEGVLLEATIRDKHIIDVLLRKVILNQTFQPRLPAP